MQAIATIELDTPGSWGPVRGVLCWRRTEQDIVLLDPRCHADAESVSDGAVATLDEALQAIHDGWGADGGDTWGLAWLCEEPEDYAS